MSSSPQSFQKRQRERKKQQKRMEKIERRLARSQEKRELKEGGYTHEIEIVDMPTPDNPEYPDDPTQAQVEEEAESDDPPRRF